MICKRQTILTSLCVMVVVHSQMCIILCLMNTAKSILLTWITEQTWIVAKRNHIITGISTKQWFSRSKTEAEWPSISKQKINRQYGKTSVGLWILLTKHGSGRVSNCLMCYCKYVGYCNQLQAICRRKINTHGRSCFHSFMLMVLVKHEDLKNTRNHFKCLK